MSKISSRKGAMRAPYGAVFS
ncbi:MAG: hypothetical protein RL706_1453, partial [Pseudomonadota bacterium]